MVSKAYAAAHEHGADMNVFNRVEPIDASDEFIRQAVEQADLPSLMVTLAMVTGDTSLILVCYDFDVQTLKARL